MINVRKFLVLMLLSSAAVTTACEDELLFPEMDVIADTVVLYSAARENLTGLPAAFNFVTLQRIPIEVAGASGQWDVMLTEQNGQLVFVPAGAIPELAALAEITVVEGTSFDALTRAPSGNDVYVTEPVSVRSGVVYVVRTRSSPCTLYAKFRVLAADADDGNVRFEFLQNPNCGNRALEVEDE